MPKTTAETPSPSRGDTRTCLLDAAELLFAEHGIPGASLRAITRQAGANLAAAHYHFGSKEGLVREVLARHLGPINRERLALLDQAVADGGGAGPSLGAVIHAFVAPVIAFGHDQPDRGRAFAQICGRAFSSPDPMLRTVLRGELREVIERFLPTFHRALPQLSREELLWRIHFMVGSMAHTMVGTDMLREVAQDDSLARDPERTARYLVRYLSHALSAPPSEEL